MKTHDPASVGFGDASYPLGGIVLGAFLVVEIVPIIMVDVDVFYRMPCDYVIFYFVII